MGRSTNFAGITVIIPDAYSFLDLNRLLTPTASGLGIVALVGESDGGAPGLHIFPGGASPSVVKSELKGGPGAHASRLALRSGSDNLVQAGASTVLFYKTNPSTQSTLALSTKGTLTTKQYGLFTTQFTGQLDAVLGGKVLTVRDEFGVPEMSPNLETTTYFSVDYTGDATTATMTFEYDLSSVLRLKIALVGQTDGSLSLDIPVGSLTISQLVQLISARPGYTASVLNNKGNVLAKEMDLVLTAGAIELVAAGPFSFKAGQYELVSWTSQTSLLVTYARAAGNAGDKLPATVAIALFAGGVRGTTTNSLHQTALNNLLKFRANILVPLFSSDSQDGSTVTIASINSQVKDHVETRSSLLGRSECQAYVSIKGNKTAFLAECARLSSRWVAVTSQQVTDLDIDGNTVKFDEWAFATVCAQTQAGSPIGTPLEYRQIPSSGITQDSSWDSVLNAAEILLGGGLLAQPDENNVLRIKGGYTCWLADTNNANIYIEMVESFAVFAFNHRAFMKGRFLGRSSFSPQDVLDAIAESVSAERDTIKSIKGYDLSLTKLISTTGGELRYEVAVIGWEGIRFILPTIVGIREGQAA